VQQSVKLIHENSMFVSVNTTIQVKVITKVISNHFNHDVSTPTESSLGVSLCTYILNFCSVWIHVFLDI
jgi:hypothetical protein